MHWLKQFMWLYFLSKTHTEWFPETNLYWAPKIRLCTYLPDWTVKWYHVAGWNCPLQKKLHHRNLQTNQQPLPTSPHLTIPEGAANHYQHTRSHDHFEGNFSYLYYRKHVLRENNLTDSYLVHHDFHCKYKDTSKSFFSYVHKVTKWRDLSFRSFLTL